MAEHTYTYRIPFGPVHPGLKEPVSFVFELEGERVRSMRFKPGWVHRGIEYMGMQRNPIQVIYLAERICGICSVSHALNFCLAVEYALGITVPPRADYLRTVVAELERLHSHILWAGVAAHMLGFDSLFYYTWRVREEVMDVLEYLTGNRVNYGFMTIGGVRRDLTPEGAAKVRENLKHYRELFDRLKQAFLDDPSIRLRTRGVGVLPERAAWETGAVGPTKRASGIPADLRQDLPYCAYADLAVEAVTPAKLGAETLGDVYDRVLVRLGEVAQSLDILEACLDNLPSGPAVAEPKLTRLLNSLKQAGGEATSALEAPRGEVYHFVRLAEGEENVAVWKVRAPTYANLAALVPMMEGAQIADIPIIVASIDPCLSCTDRMLAVRSTPAGGREVLTGEELLRLCAEKTRRVVPCSALYG
ncbi:MAG: nickel-dependent hydrogenase large subunit [Clostridia bacterium]|jgi:membrane-bound hydrogenase subunit alpha|nr:nickel-dependent hydrogenase large subunit [Clostridia bacterium]MDH7573017.1 nickel-dependent hydrogenase large subunit [Clostridia bacterium]